jgi:hypothetical protein
VDLIVKNVELREEQVVMNVTDHGYWKMENVMIVAIIKVIFQIKLAQFV